MIRPAQRHLVAFVKAPRMGRVKSRLAKDIGMVGAWQFYRRTLAQVLTPLARDLRWRLWLCVTPDGAVFQDRVWPVRTSRLTQGTGDLGARMGRAMAILPPGPVVIIGTDIPGIRSNHVAAAFQALGSYDAVFGPATDGGYWLVGLKRRPRLPDAFRQVRWSGPHALHDTERNLVGLQIAQLEALVDVDDARALIEAQQKT